MIFDLTLVYICYCRPSLENQKQSSYLWFPLFLLLVQVKCTVQIPLPENAILIPVMWYEWSSVDLVSPGICAESVRCDWRIILAFLCFLDWGVVFMVNLGLGFKTSNFKFNLNLDLEQVGERLMAKLWRKWRSDKTVPGSESTHYEANLCNVQSADLTSFLRASMPYIWRSDKSVPGGESTHYKANFCNVQSAYFARCRFNESPLRTFNALLFLTCLHSLTPQFIF